MSEAISNLNVTNPLTIDRGTPSPTNTVEQDVKVDRQQASQVNQSGSEKIEQQRAAQKEVEKEQEAVEEVASKLQEFVNLIDKKLQFSVDEDSGRQVVRVTDKLSGDVIRQIPSEEVLRLARNLSDLAETANKSGKIIVTEA